MTTFNHLHSNACPGCGAYTANGEPPILHQPACTLTHWPLYPYTQPITTGTTTFKVYYHIGTP